MKKINRIMMVQSMVNTLVDSIKEYESFENKNGYPPMYGSTEPAGQGTVRKGGSR